jgi:acetylornithine aminotransferase
LTIRKYIDFTAGIAVVALGHADPTIAQLMYEQSLQLNHCSNLYHSPWSGELAKLIIETTKAQFPKSPFQKVFLSNSGTEANEAALKFARKVGKLRGGDSKVDIVCFDRAFHGRTFGALSVTPQPKYQKPFAPMVPGVKVGTLNDIAALETLVDDKTCGVIVEPIQGEGGVYEATEEFLTALRQRCNKVGAVLIYDEIQVRSNLTCANPVWIISNWKVMGTSSFLTINCLRYSHNGETTRKWFPNWCSHGIDSNCR